MAKKLIFNPITGKLDYINTDISSGGGTTSWKWDATKNRWYLEISGSRVAEIDENGIIYAKRFQQVRSF